MGEFGAAVLDGTFRGHNVAVLEDVVDGTIGGHRASTWWRDFYLD